MRKAIIGAGGFAREVKAHLDDVVDFFVDDEYWDPSISDFFPLSKFNHETHEVLIAIGDSNARLNIVQRLPPGTKFFSFIHPSALILDNNIEIGEGSIVCAGCILTTNISIGKHAHLNLQTTIGHDTRIGDYFTSAPGVKISGNCLIGDGVYFGTNSCTKQRIRICSGATIGLNAGVVNNITEPGIYVGTPAIKIK